MACSRTALLYFYLTVFRYIPNDDAVTVIMILVTQMEQESSGVRYKRAYGRTEENGEGFVIR
jgi:hypothetical protein